MKFNLFINFGASVLASILLLRMLNIPVYGATTTISTVQDFQKHINTAMISRSTEYSLNYIGDRKTLISDIPNIFNDIFNSDDYLATTIKSYDYSYTNTIRGVTIKFTFIYWNTEDMESFVNTRIEQILVQIIKPTMNDYEKEKAIHDWIISNVSYDTTLVKHSDYDALVAPFKTVCQGYALLAYKMLNQVGIKTKIETGLADGKPHAWDLVCLDGVWYQLDVTWDDTLSETLGRIAYNYYNLTDEELKLTHSWTPNYSATTAKFSDGFNDDTSNGSTNNEIRYKRKEN